MRGVMFDNRHSYWNWGLMLKKAPEVSPPEPKTHYVDIIGADGMLDLSESLTGKVKYKNRKIDMEFIIAAGREDWSAVYDEILENVHGKLKKISLEDETGAYYTGRVTVGTPERDGKIITLKMSADVEPYRKTTDGRRML